MLINIEPRGTLIHQFTAGGQGTAEAGKMMKKAIPRIAGLYRGVFGAASGAGIAIGAYFAFYGAATNVLVKRTEMKPSSIAFTAGAIAAAGGSIVKVPLAVCIRSVQAGVYPNVIKAASEITSAAGKLRLPQNWFTDELFHSLQLIQYTPLIGTAAALHQVSPSLSHIQVCM